MRTDLIEAPKTLSDSMFTEVHDLVCGIVRIQLGGNDHSVCVCNQASLVGGIITGNATSSHRELNDNDAQIM